MPPRIPSCRLAWFSSRRGAGNHALVVQLSDLAFPETEHIPENLVGVLSDPRRAPGGLPESGIEDEG